MNSSVPYPQTSRGEVRDQYFGTSIDDPYRWLEDDHSQETMDWVDRQNACTFGYLETLPERESWKEELTRLWNYEKRSVPFRKGDWLYFYKNDGLQNQAVLCRSRDGKEEVFLDPNGFSEDGTASLVTISFTDDASLCAYSVSEGGSDWQKIYVIEVESRRQLEDPLLDVKFSGISWKGNEGFFYSSYDKPEGSELSAKTDWHKLYFHALGCDQDKDRLAFGRNEAEKRRYVWGRVSKDSRYLFVEAAQSTSGNELYLVSLDDAEGQAVPMVSGFDCDARVVFDDAGTFYIETDYRAPKRRLMRASASRPAIGDWEELIPECQEVLSVSAAGPYLFAHYLKDATSSLCQYRLDGSQLRSIDLPGKGTVLGFSGEKEDTVVYYAFTNYVTAMDIYEYELETGRSSLHWRPAIEYRPEDFVCEQHFYTSKDGTRIPLFVTHRKDLKLDGSNPTLLYGYGGFNISLTPAFSVANLVWLLRGGVYAVANLRGGGEYGKDWHLAGTKTRKQNVFDDCIAAAEYLIDRGYTRPSSLALSGRSNGGLLVGACMTQRPDLFAVALPGVGVLDMLRYHTFTAGAGWAYDYGTAEESQEMFRYLLSYSPVHNVRAGTRYPATLVTTADHDDRVVPAHSFKFIAELQAKQGGEAPVLIRIDKNAGHGMGKSVSMLIAETADCFAFARAHLA